MYDEELASEIEEVRIRIYEGLNRFLLKYTDLLMVAQGDTAIGPPPWERVDDYDYILGYFGDCEAMADIWIQAATDVSAQTAYDMLVEDEKCVGEAELRNILDNVRFVDEYDWVNDEFRRINIHTVLAACTVENALFFM